MSDFNLISPEGVLARISDELSSYSSNGLLDQGKSYSQIVWFSQKLGLAVFEQDETILNLSNHKAELPCNYYLLDSAWLCDAHPTSEIYNFQSRSIAYEQIECELVKNFPNCALPDSNSLYPLSISANPRDMEKVLRKKTQTEYVVSNNEPIRWHHPKLLRLNNKKSLAPICSKDCQNLFSHYPEEISINRQGNSYYLYSSLKSPIIYIKYYSYPIDKETNLPLVADDPILIEALVAHLKKYFFELLFINGDESNTADKLKYLNDDAKVKMGEAMYLSKLPSFNKMIQVGYRVRKKFSSYEIMNTKHW